MDISVNRLWLVMLVFGVVVASGNANAKQEQACTLVREVGGEHPVYMAGARCSEDFSPASTFKLPLFLIGVEEGVITSATAPVRPYDPALKAPYKSWRQSVDPRHWLRYSVIWYSQWLTSELGMKRFQAYVNALGYGNQDLTGDKRYNNGLSHAWLSTSLKISPLDQLDFLDRLLREKLQLSGSGKVKLLDAIPEFDADGDIRISGKTGNAWATDSNGDRLQQQHGWFVGWFSHADKDYVFVHLRIEDGRQKGFASSRAKSDVLDNISHWLD